MCLQLHKESTEPITSTGQHFSLQAPSSSFSTNHFRDYQTIRIEQLNWELYQTQKVKVLATQSHPTLCNSVGFSQPGSSLHGFFQARIQAWQPFPSPGDLLNPEIKHGSPALQVDSLPSGTPEKPRSALKSKSANPEADLGRKGCPGSWWPLLLKQGHTVPRNHSFPSCSQLL